MLTGLEMDHRITQSRSDLQRSSSSISCAELAWLKQITLGCVQSGFDYFHRRTSHNFSGQPVPVFDHDNFKNSLHFSWKISQCVSFSGPVGI